MILGCLDDILQNLTLRIADRKILKSIGTYLEKDIKTKCSLISHLIAFINVFDEG